MSEIVNKISHRVWRKLVKKLRRKKLRQKMAKKRDELLEKKNSVNLKNPTYLTWLAEQGTSELLREELEVHLRQETQRQWLEYDNLVQERWKIKQEKVAKIEQAQEEEKMRIRAEFEANNERLRKLKEEKFRAAEEKLKEHERLAEAIDRYINDRGDLPDELKVNAESNPGKPICPFFEKTSTCRYGFKCSRNHCRPGISRLLLIPNFFSHIRLDQSKLTEYGNDFSLEIDDAELNRDFNEFFGDVEPELARFGEIKNFCVCSNQEPHLRGHTYVEFNDQRNALKAYRHLQGRYYAGRMLNVEFSQMITWRSAVCGLSFANKCPKGRSCNFLHIFKNPRNRYPLFDRYRSNANQQWLSTTRRRSLDRNRNDDRFPNWDEGDAHSSTRTRNWRWSESPETDVSNKRRSISRSKTRYTKNIPQQSAKSRSRSSQNSHKDNKGYVHRRSSNKTEKHTHTHQISKKSEGKRHKRSSEATC